MDSLQSLEQSLTQLLGMPPHIQPEHLAALDRLLTREATIALIDAVFANESALAVISARSYTHALGFRKITLIEPVFDLPDGGKASYQVRLHIWQPDSDMTVPLVESKHKHGFDFISRVLIGEMENQCYTMHELTDAEQALLARLRLRIEQLESAERTAANRGVEVLEALRMAAFGSQQAINEGLQVDRAHMRQLLAVSDEELDQLIGLQGRFQYDNAASKFGGNYVHSMTSTVCLRPHGVLKLKAGDLYHHPHQYIHRLYMRAQKANATLIVTTPVVYGASGGSFQHPTWFAGENIQTRRRMYTPDELAPVLRQFRTQLATLSATEATRLLDVANLPVAQ
jgi:hypothetical protein